MILKALYDYYYRSGDLAPAGIEIKEIAFLIVIYKDGNFIRLEDRRIDKKNCSKFAVAKGVIRSSAPVANILWDNCAYVLGLSDADFSDADAALDEEKRNKWEKEVKKVQSKNLKCNSVFVAQIEKLYEEHSESVELRALHLFYERYNKDQILEVLQQDIKWQDFSKNLTRNISFMMEGDTEIIAEKRHLFPKEKEKYSNKGLCLITGDFGEIVEITSATPILGGQATGKLVAFQVNSGYDSYGRSKGGNAPISADAEFCYTTALKNLLDKDSRNKFNIGSRTFAFWASSDNEVTKEVEESVFSLFGFVEETKDDPNARIEQARKVFHAIYSGSLNTNLDYRFYILGLAPNAARIAVVYWSECTLKSFAGSILKHFEDMDIVDTRKDGKPFLGLRAMMSAVTLRGKVADVQPNLPETVMKSMLQGIPYPYTLFNACINRIRAEQDENQSVTIGRAAILKAYLNRLSNDINKKIEVMIDKENSNQGYLCGRLFAVLERIQERANGASTIRSRYMNAASATPIAVFPTILNLSVHHAEKLDKGVQIWFEQIKSEIVDKIMAEGFPCHLSLPDQGRFFVGYYHQRQCFFTKKDDAINELENNVE